MFEKYFSRTYDMMDFPHFVSKDELGFSKVETIRTGTWSNENDESGLADYCRSLNTYLTFSGFTRHCIK